MSDIRCATFRVVLFPILLFACISAGCRSGGAAGFRTTARGCLDCYGNCPGCPNLSDAIGKTVAREVVSIQPQVSGQITKIHFVDGADVKKGDLLFTIDTRPFEASLQQAQANLLKSTALKKQAEANMTRDIAQAKWGEVQVTRYKS